MTPHDPIYRLRILHVSDLHERVALDWMEESRRKKIAQQAAQRGRVLGDCFKDALGREIQSTGRIDLVCFTGDVADWGLRPEYERATARMSTLLDAAGVPLERFFVVPGNHDVQWPQARGAWEQLRRLAAENPDALSYWMGGTSSPYGAQAGWRDEVLARTAEFWKWVTVDLGRKPLDPATNPHGRLGYRESLRLPGLPFDIHLIGLDSAWLAGDDNDAKKLRLSQSQIDLLARDGENTLPGFRLALAHHPLDELADGAHCRRLLADSVDLLLHGHQHDPIAAEHHDPDGQFRVLAAGSLFEGDAGDRWRNSFHLVEVRLDSQGKPLCYEIVFWGWSPEGTHWYRTGGIYKAAEDGRLVWWTPHGRQALRSGDWPARLAVLLGAARDAEQLRKWVRFNARSIEQHPSIAAAHDREALAKAIAGQIREKGLAADTLFDSLHDLGSPRWEVEWVRVMWKASTAEAPAGTSATGWLTPGRTKMADSKSTAKPARKAASKSTAKPATPAGAAASEAEASHTSIVLDRIGQWRTILEHCGTRHEHLVFVVHGTPEQGLSLFMKRITSYLHHECLLVHRVVKVERTVEHTTACTAAEWERILIQATRVADRQLDRALEWEARKAPVLFLFAQDEGPLRNLDKPSVRGLVELFRSRLDPVLRSFEGPRALKNSLRFVLPIEHGAQGTPAIQELAGAFQRARAFQLEPVKELGFPPWEEVRAHIQAEVEAPDEELFDECEHIYRRIERSSERSLQRLGDALEPVLMDWEDRDWYKRR